MTGFLPVNPVLLTTDEYKSLSVTITYTEIIEGLETNFAVSISPDSDSNNSSIIIDGNTISGFFSNCFHDIIYYRNKNDTFTTVNSFSAINTDKMYGLVYFFADLDTSRTYSYVATANGQSKTYTIVVNNNWNYGRSNLLKYADIDNYNTYGIRWINNLSLNVTWLNNSGTPVRWLN